VHQTAYIIALQKSISKEDLNILALEFDKDKIQLIALDLDDTIIEHGVDISSLTLSAIKQVHNLGITVIISTGRLMGQIPPVLRNSPFIRYFAASNGGIIFDNVLKKPILRNSLERDQVSKIVRIGNQTGAGIYISLEESSYCDIKCLMMSYRSIRKKYTRAQRKEAKKLYRFKMLPFFGHTRFISRIKNPVFKVSCLYKTKELRKSNAALYQAVRGVSTASVTGNGLEITSDNATKGFALGYICREMEISKENVMVFGDSGNDLSMRDYAGVFIAMGNADPEVKEIADFVTGTVSEDGAAMFLLNHVQGIAEKNKD